MPLLRFRSHPEQSLQEHLKNVSSKTIEITNQTKFENKNLAFYAGLFHDLGKLGPYYQELFSKPKINDSVKTELAKKFDDFHSVYSCWIAKKILKGKCSFENIQKILMLIYAHHGKLKNPPKVYDGKIQEKSFKTKKIIIENWKKFKIEQKDTTLFRDFDLEFDLCFDDNIKILKQINPKEDAIAEFVEIGFLFSALLQADKGSFTDFKLKKFEEPIDTSGLEKSSSPLAKYRTNFQKQVQNELDSKKPITIINAPTGIGKTKAFLDSINKFDVDHVFYFSPLLALTNDMEMKIKTNKIVDPNEILAYNHTYVGTLKNKDNENYTPEWNFDHEAFNEKFIITTTHRLLMSIYSNKSRDKMKFASFRNSLLIVDEIQTLPKFLLGNLCNIFNIMADKMGTKVLLVSATIPFELKKLPTIKMNSKQNLEYLKTRNHKIIYCVFDPCNIKHGKNLIMLNTRRNAKEKYEQVKKNTNNVYYITSGLRKKDQDCIIDHIKNKTNNDIILVSTQVIEAGVDVSFTNIWRQMAPLDNIIQVLGRLDRENENHDSTLFIFEGQTHTPYSSLEYKISKKFIENVNDSVCLYEKLDEYYKEISEKNQTQKNESENLHHHITKLNFERVWEEVRDNLSDSYHSTVYIPDQADWNNVRTDLLSSNKNLIKKHENLVASWPNKKINEEFFDEELLEKDILLPKKEKMDEIYDKTIGLDICLN